MKDQVEKFRSLIDFRDLVIERKFGDKRQDAFNYPENRFWYADHVSPIDKEIVTVANQILSEKYNTKSDFKTIADVFKNEELKAIYLNQTKAEEISK